MQLIVPSDGTMCPDRSAFACWQVLNEPHSRKLVYTGGFIVLGLVLLYLLFR